MSQRASSSRITLDLAQMNQAHPPHYNDVPQPMFAGERIAASRGHSNPGEAIIRNSIYKDALLARLYNLVPRPATPRKCHPETRVQFLRFMHDRIAQAEGARDNLVMCLVGEAGVGKSAIMQSLAESLFSAGKGVGCFFVSKLDPNLNSLQRLVPTLAAQLIYAIPETRDCILSMIAKYPGIFEQPLEWQLKALVVEPLIRLPRDRPKQQFIVLIDGLDECINQNEQLELLRILNIFISQYRNFPIAFVIASRPEDHIRTALDRFQVPPTVLELDECPENVFAHDIRTYLRDNFRLINETHQYRHLLPENWPAPSDIDEIVANADGLFIYATVVVNFLLHSRHNPAERLQLLKEIKPRRRLGKEDRFQHLDGLYRFIFGQVDDFKSVKNILALALLDNKEFSWSPYILEATLMLERGTVDELMDVLSSVMFYSPLDYDTESFNANGRIKFLHASSLLYFLFDKKRAGVAFHIDLAKCRDDLLCSFFDPDKENNLTTVSFYWRTEAMLLLFKHTVPSKRLRLAVMRFGRQSVPLKIDTKRSLSWVRKCARILRCLKELDLGDRGEAYHKVLDLFALDYANDVEWDGYADVGQKLAEEAPELAERIRQLNPQLASILG